MYIKKVRKLIRPSLDERKTIIQDIAVSKLSQNSSRVWHNSCKLVDCPCQACRKS